MFLAIDVFGMVQCEPTLIGTTLTFIYNIFFQVTSKIPIFILSQVHIPSVVSGITHVPDLRGNCLLLARLFILLSLYGWCCHSVYRNNELFSYFCFRRYSQVCTENIYLNYRTEVVFL